MNVSVGALKYFFFKRSKGAKSFSAPIEVIEALKVLQVSKLFMTQQAVCPSKAQRWKQTAWTIVHHRKLFIAS